MEKYRLLKDLPTVEAGEIFELKENGSLLFQGSNKSAGMSYSKEEVIVFDLLNHDKGWFEKIEEKKYGGKVPKKGDAFWFISYNGSIIKETWDGASSDHNVFESGSAFWTEEEAEKELRRRKAYVILKEDTKGFKPDWNNSYELKHAVYYDYANGKLAVASFGGNQYVAGLFFATQKDTEASIRAHRQLWLDYLGIEEEE